jgi:hypothetical protein
MVSNLFWSLAYCSPLPFFGPRVGFYLRKTKQFFCILGFVWTAFLTWLSVLVRQTNPKAETDSRPQKGAFKAQ